MLTRAKSSTSSPVRVSDGHGNLPEAAAAAVGTKRKDASKQSKSSKKTDNGKACRPPKFSFVIDGLLAGLGRPTVPGHLKFLCDNDIQYIVTLTINKPRALLDLPDKLQWVHIPIQDETPPSLDQIQQFVALVDSAKDEGKRVGVHCAWGRGRTGTMLACYLAKHLGLTADEAVTQIRSLRSGSVDTKEQENAIKSYVDFLSSPLQP